MQRATTAARGLPAHPDFKLNQPDPDVMADTFITRAQAWNDHYVVVDHGGGLTCQARSPTGHHPTSSAHAAACRG
jgi:hypothetical protein